MVHVSDVLDAIVNVTVTDDVLAVWAGDAAGVMVAPAHVSTKETPVVYTRVTTAVTMPEMPVVYVPDAVIAIVSLGRTVYVSAGAGDAATNWTWL